MSIFELLCKIDHDDILDTIYREGKTKPYCPIRFFTDEQIEEFKQNHSKEK